MKQQTTVQTQNQTMAPPFMPGGILQRTCSCGRHTVGGRECATCRQQRQKQRCSASETATQRSRSTEKSSVSESFDESRVPRTISAQATSSRFQQDFSQVSAGAAYELGASLPQEEDPIHRPLIEEFRRENNLPPGGIDEEGNVVGPTDAEIKYGTPLESNVFYVSFQNVMPPDQPDHSQSNPGPSGSAANRAGYTRVRLRKRMSIPWETLPALPDGRVPLYAQSVNVFYRLDPIEVYVSADYAKGSCPYRVTLAHERSHVRDFIRIFHTGRESLIRSLNRVSVPTQEAPRPVAPPDLGATQDAVGNALRQVVVDHSANLVAQMEADRNAKDAPAAYAQEYAKCPATEW